jgi:hypothetical protein
MLTDERAIRGVVVIMLKRLFVLVCGVAFFAMQASAGVRMDAGFETGQIQAKDGVVDAGLIRTLPDPQKGDETFTSGSGGCGPSSNCDLRVVKSETVGGETIQPREGDYYLRMLLDKSKDYTGLNGGKPKPRNAFSQHQEDIFGTDWDEEAWMGFSVFIPSNYEHETAAPTTHHSLTEVGVDSTANLFKLVLQNKSSDGSTRWYMKYYTNDSAVSNLASGTVEKDAVLGFVNADLGKWTDFVIRFRANPFSTPTNPVTEGIANSRANPNHPKGQWPANTGILQVWKSTGPVDANGNREMRLAVDVENVPVGLVPPQNYQGRSLIHYNIRSYKGGWQGYNGKPTSVNGPIYIAFDGYSFGETMADGAGYRDVHPTGMACTQGCPGGGLGEEASKPKAPILQNGNQ